MENSEREERNLIKKCQINYALHTYYIATETFPSLPGNMLTVHLLLSQKLTNVKS